MRSRVVAAALTVSSCLLAAIALPPIAHAESDSELVQVGTYGYLTQPNFTGLRPIRDVLPGQTLGLGTFDDLDGEFVLVGGTAYRVATDGVPRIVREDVTTPFLQAVRFRPERSGPVPPGTTCAQLTPIIDALAGSSDGVVAVRVRGTFTDLVARSVGPVPPPFKPLSDVVAGQTVFPLGTARAVLVGFRQGPDALGLGQPGLHLHGLTANRSAGGHILSCVVGPDIQISIEKLDQVRVLAPSKGSR